MKYTYRNKLIPEEKVKNKTCVICEGSGYYDKPLPNNEVEFDAVCECQIKEEHVIHRN